MGLTVHYAVIVGNNRLRCHIVGAGVLTVHTVLHDGKTVVADLRDNLSLHIVALQLGRAGVIGAKAEAAVGTALCRLGVVGAVGVLIFHLFGQFLGELRSAVIQPVHILAEAIIAHAHIAVHRPAGFATGFRPVISGYNRSFP